MAIPQEISSGLSLLELYNKDIYLWTKEAFPVENEFSLEQMLDADFLPQSA